MNIVVKAPEVPAITVFFIAMATTAPSPGLEMEPSEEPLNAKNPKIRINPPRAANYNAILLIQIVDTMFNFYKTSQQMKCTLYHGLLGTCILAWKCINIYTNS
jgi:hypothetical protein